MEPQTSQLFVREHERHHCRIGVDLWIVPEDEEAVTLARSVGSEARMVRGTMVDCSRGGFGLEVGVFLPRKCRVGMRIREEGEGGAAPASRETLAYETRGRVQRVAMIDRKPTYYLGMAFIDDGGGRGEALECLLEFARRRASAPPSSGAGKPTDRKGAARA